MNLFDRICAALAMILGVVLLVLGIVGLFTGCKANFTLPPILGVLPALVGWGIAKSVWVAWSVGRKPAEPLVIPIPRLSPDADRPWDWTKSDNKEGRSDRASDDNADNGRL